MALQTVAGDLTKATETYLCHQCNCITNRSAHLASAVFKAFPYADVYTQRKEPSIPGTIELRGDGQDQRYVVALFGQYYPGKTKYPNSSKDGWDARFSFFKAALDKLKELPPGEFAFPWRIGCGAAGGDWDRYLQEIVKFSESRQVTIYRLDLPKSKKPEEKLF